MIALLTGNLEAIESDRCIIDVNGVGYLVFASTRTLDHLNAATGPARVLIETQVREDAINLYGFADAAERDWFRLLTTVQGVGARLALNILSTLSPRDLVAAINAGDRGSLTRASGVGVKLAIRLLTELRDKAGGMPTAPGFVSIVPVAAQGPAADAVSALINLGYRRPEAQAAIDHVEARLGKGESLDRLIREGLRELSH